MTVHYSAKQVRLMKDNSRPNESDPFLARLGERVRTMRSRRGMSRKVLARHSDVSERYLAQLEAGAGNCSIVLLRRIAEAMSVPVAELVDDRPERPLEAVLLEQFLGRLSAGEIGEARNLLLERFGGSTSAMRGGGKSTLGALLAERLGAPFIELDRIIEQRSGMALGEMIEMFGQETFRRNERAALESILQQNPRFVLATGGGLVTEPATFELLLSSCLTIWVRAEPDEHMQRVIAQGDRRPMADNVRAMDDLVSILKSREPLYAKADIVLDTADKAPRKSLEELSAVLGVSAKGGACRSAIFVSAATFLSMTRIAWPSALRRARQRQISSRMRGASPSVASSRMSSRGFVMRARPTASICCSPPESRLPILPWRSARRGNIP
jgi:XRE family aerobic/anaerobic benzoate catabolism transcriptional regulator